MQSDYSNVDARDLVDYNEAHVILAKSAKKDEDGQYRMPFGVHLPSCLNCVVYDSNTVSIVEDSTHSHNTRLV